MRRRRAQRRGTKRQSARPNSPSLPVPEANRLAASAPFSALQGQIALPVTGRIKRRFGGDDGNGGVMLGDMVATQSGSHRHRAVPTGAFSMRGRSGLMVNS